MEIGLRDPPAGLVEALERLGSYFAGRRTRQGFLARRLLGRASPGDAALADHLIRERRVATRMDGSLGGDAVRTAWAAWELMDLGQDHQSAGTVRLVGYLLGRLAPVAEADRPTFLRAESLSPGPLTLPNGCMFDDREQALFAASTLALKVVLRARGDARPVIRSYVQALRDDASLWALDGPRAHDLAAAALGALALAPLDLRDRLEGYARMFASAQEPDGTWPGADLFHVLEAMIATGAPTANTVVQRALPALIARQAPDGAFDDHEERGLIALRALLRAS